MPKSVLAAPKQSFEAACRVTEICVDGRAHSWLKLNKVMDVLPSGFSSQTVNKCLFMICSVSHIFVLCVGDFAI